MENKENVKLERARRRVDRIKGFYIHLAIFIIFNTALFLLKDELMGALVGEEALSNPKVTDWVYWNILVWLAILVIHALIIFGNIPFLGKNWEERQIRKFMNEGQDRERYE